MEINRIWLDIFSAVGVLLGEKQWARWAEQKKKKRVA